MLVEYRDNRVKYIKMKERQNRNRHLLEGDGVPLDQSLFTLWVHNTSAVLRYPVHSLAFNSLSSHFLCVSTLIQRKSISFYFVITLLCLNLFELNICLHGNRLGRVVFRRLFVYNFLRSSCGLDRCIDDGNIIMMIHARQQAAGSCFSLFWYFICLEICIGVWVF